MLSLGRRLLPTWAAASRELLPSRPFTDGNSGKRDPFPVVESRFQPDSEAGRRNRAENKDWFELTLREREEVFEKAKTVPKGSNRLNVYQRIELLRDEDSDVLYLSVTAGRGMPYGTVNSAGTITAIADIVGETCVITANDWTFKGGTIYPVTLKKQLRAQEIAMANRLPSIALVDSGGAFLPLQADIFPDKNQGGRVFRNQAVMSSMKIPQIAVVCGPCTAGGAYIPTMSDEAVIVKGKGSLYLGGPPLVKAATGEEIGAEELGGADVHCGISGCTDHYAASEEEAMAVTRSIVVSLNRKRRSHPGRTEPEPPIYSGGMEEMAALIPTCRGEERWPMMEIIARVFDGSRFHHFKDKFGANLICGFARLNGHLVGVVANHGVLDAPSAVKGSHFVRLCSLRDVPLVFLQHTPSDEDFLSAVGNVGAVAKARAQMMAYVSCAEVAKITIVLGNSYGPSSYAMCSRAMSPNFLFSWPGARVGVASPNHILNSMLEQKENGSEEVLRRLEEEEQTFSNYVGDDGVILPHETRQVLCRALDACLKYQDSSHSISLPVIRM